GMGKGEGERGGFVECVDRVGADEPLGGIGEDHVELLGQIVGERQAGGEIVFEIGFLAAKGVVSARAQRAPASRVVVGAIAWRGTIGLALLTCSVAAGSGCIARSPVRAR